MEELLKKHIERAKEYGVSEEHAPEVVQWMVDVLSAFIDAAWGTHPVQLAQGKNQEKLISSEDRCARIRTIAEQKLLNGPAAEAAGEERTPT